MQPSMSAPQNQSQMQPQMQLPAGAVFDTDLGREAHSLHATQIVQQGLKDTFGVEMMPAQNAKKGSGAYNTDYTYRLYELGGQVLKAVPALAATLIGGKLSSIVTAMPPGPAGQGKKWPTTLKGYASQHGQFLAYVRSEASGIKFFQDNPSNTDTTGLFTAGTSLTHNGVTVTLRMTHFCATPPPPPPFPPSPLMPTCMCLLIGTPRLCRLHAQCFTRHRPVPHTPSGAPHLHWCDANTLATTPRSVVCLSNSHRPECSGILPLPP